MQPDPCPGPSNRFGCHLLGHVICSLPMSMTTRCSWGSLQLGTATPAVIRKWRRSAKCPGTEVWMQATGLCFQVIRILYPGCTSTCTFCHGISHYLLASLPSAARAHFCPWPNTPGIIDLFTHYGKRKTAEYALKSLKDGFMVCACAHRRCCCLQDGNWFLICTSCCCLSPAKTLSGKLKVFVCAPTRISQPLC